MKITRAKLIANLNDEITAAQVQLDTYAAQLCTKDALYCLRYNGDTLVALAAKINVLNSIVYSLVEENVTLLHITEWLGDSMMSKARQPERSTGVVYNSAAREELAVIADTFRQLQRITELTA